MSFSDKKNSNHGQIQTHQKDNSLSSKLSISSPSLRNNNVRSSVTFQEYEYNDSSIIDSDKKSGSTPVLTRKKNLANLNSSFNHSSSNLTTIDKMKKKHIIKEYDDLNRQVEVLHSQLQQAYLEIEELKQKWISTTGTLPNQDVPTTVQSACACEAAANGDIIILQQMLERGADIHSPNGDGRTSLHLAISKGKEEIASFLLNSGANLNTKDIWGNTPFDECLRLNRGNIAQLIEVSYSTQSIKSIDRDYRLGDYISSGKEKDQQHKDLPTIQRKISKFLSYIEGNTSTPSLEQNNKSSKSSKDRFESFSMSPTNSRKHDKKKHSKSHKGLLRMFHSLIKGSSQSNRDIQELSTNNETQKPYCVAFGILRGSCQVISCHCECFAPNEKSTHCTCGHFPASHENLGTEHLLEGLQHLNIIEESSLEVLVEKEVGQEWPKKLNLNLEGDEYTEELAQMWKDEKKEWIIKACDLTFIRKIGQGASANVYEGMYKTQRVAIKLMNFKPNSKKPSDKVRKELIEEFNIMSIFKHDHVVKFYGVCVETRLCMVLDFCEHGSLYDFISDEPSIDVTWELVFKWMKQTVEGVQALHSWNPPIVHRDLKTLNLLVDDHRNIKVADFGLSRFVKDSASQTTLGKLRGTYAYAAPEVYMGENYSHKSDIYSISIILWELVTKAVTGSYHRPYGEFSFINYDFQIIIQVAKKNARPTIHENTPKLLKELISMLWSPNPDVRPDCKTLLKILNEMESTYMKNMDEWNAMLKSGKLLEIQTSPSISRRNAEIIPPLSSPKSSSTSKTENTKSNNEPQSPPPKITKNQSVKVSTNETNSKSKVGSSVHIKKTKKKPTS